MNKISYFSFLGIYFLLSLSSFAQNTPLPTIKGKLDIIYNTRTQLDDMEKPKAGVQDVYTYNLVAIDTLLFQGTIHHQPTLFSSILGREIQSAFLTYNMEVSIRNPKNMSQVKNIGKLIGTVPIDRKGVYRYSDGTFRMAIDSVGQASGFDSKFQGLAEGKPPVNTSKLARAQKQAVTVTKSVSGKKMNIVVSDYDVMRFSGLELAAGPAKVYSEVKVDGEMLFDYERSAWYFQKIQLAYLFEGKPLVDRLSGSIKWIEHPERSTNGEGHYDFDVRVNEPDPSETEAAVFEAAEDESAFFEATEDLPALTGTAKYKDIIKNEVVQASTVTLDLKGKGLNKIQVVNLMKLIWFISVVPMNAE